ncbi:MAG: hypothetical protein IMY76_03645 [Chloroflexi bacterium]|nr:hypothetical protein [Chloroflexota bacterium]
MKNKEIGQGLVEYQIFYFLFWFIIMLLTAWGFTESQIATIICRWFGICS